MFLISIPNPCREDWNEMSPSEEGAFCKVCSKTVVDFTSLSDEELKSYFLNHQGQRTCGRFRNDQLTPPKNLHDLLSRPVPFWKKFLAIVLVLFASFLTSCNDKKEINQESRDRHCGVSSGCNDVPNATLGITLPQIVPDTTSSEVIGTSTELIIDSAPLIIESERIMPIVIEEKSDTVAGINIDTAKQIGSVMKKIDTAKSVSSPNNCDTLLRKVIEP